MRTPSLVFWLFTHIDELMTFFFHMWLAHRCRSITYRIYSNKRRGAYLIFRATSAALIWGRCLFEAQRRCLFKHCTRQIYFFFIFIQRYIFYLLIFLWTDTKLIKNLELREKFTRWKKTESFVITRAKISTVRASGVRRLFEGGVCLNFEKYPKYLNLLKRDQLTRSRITP